MLRIIYMGTPQFAVPALEALIAHATPGDILPEGYEIVTVITRPDKPAGRGREIVFSPVKQSALQHQLPVWQPGSFKKPENSAELAGYKADLYIVAAFGQILPQSVLDQPRYGTLNIHASLLPKYRGADPIAETILQGDKETGISIMLLDAGVDTGPVLLQRSLVIADGDTTSSLTVRLAEIGAQALLEALPLWVGGTLVPEPQNEEKASHTRMLRKEDGLIDWSRPASVIARQVRAYSPWPSAYTYWGGKLCKVLKVQVQAVTSEKEIAPGMVGVRELAGHQVLGVATGSGVLILQQLQLEGKKAMSAEEFLHGYAQIVGQKLGER